MAVSGPVAKTRLVSSGVSPRPSRACSDRSGANAATLAISIENMSDRRGSARTGDAVSGGKGATKRWSRSRSDYSGFSPMKISGLLPSTTSRRVTQPGLPTS